ncbi:hypothetical protein E8E15_002170 [Penicillium rubens]|uniref:Uncharacterized protein n=2 Tax=Penicillium chrysogenum species complex TaxID=254878 RepID=B6HLU6_PENRW|nr:uncharacterized protein N7525_006400 [Penicillium rubens]KAJ6148566.1 hypothetical protein N7497_010548 [Penicillium chrysogenum]CAP97041.1 hypothetical protein PCH_Pc21g21440 [Penicillium rubens Wisconsin 54-1255]KAF3013409.1 hypothetical protein E8E15_002170 [Penicillium rubens]KAJ5050114.1 hypothetical protein NUH16_008646 [Penicillium rubens]KAJ5828147.1 hypothetical protein N7525_006400 [Penicillium rubens]|eukprot:CAMPEP_0178970642 /NCGR_PEP_ID=MMETSP0789-20121207/19703_1 /TAXON_ID=3005 /ORGANISM="Rhizosolenia setigera, Strain CCMP 1694" /LENGTH=107 /DNA_ID=CAMNT_0020657265 /DNA_START=6 /DNA_END=329 /DNA_ORIENTATION=+
MSDFFRRASDAFHHRQRQSSTDSTEGAKSPDPPGAAKPPEQQPLNQNSQSAQPESHVNEAIAGTANDNVAQPKQHRLWGWGRHQGNKPATNQQGSQAKEDIDWVVGT